MAIDTDPDQDVSDETIDSIKEKMKARAAVEAPSARGETEKTITSMSEHPPPPAWAHVTENWSRFSASIQKVWPEVSDLEIERAAGDYDRFTAVLELRYGLEPASAREKINTWLAGVSPKEH